MCGIWRNRGLYVSYLVQLFDITAFKHTLSLRTVFSTSGPQPEFWSFLHHYYAKLWKSFVKEQHLHIKIFIPSPRGCTGHAITHTELVSKRDTQDLERILHSFFSNTTTCSYELSWSLPSWLWRKCNRLLRLGRPWGAVTLSRWCEGWYIGRWDARRGLKSRSTNYPHHGHHGDPLPTRKIPMVEPGIESGTSSLGVRSSDH